VSHLAIIKRRQASLLQLWRSNPLVPVQVDRADALGHLVYLSDSAGDGDVGPLGRRRPDSVVCVVRPGDPDLNASLWVAADYDGYRAAYVAFLRHVYAIKVSNADLQGFDADHLLNRARSPRDSTLIRLEAVPASVNQSWGNLYEKAASDPRFHANKVRERRTMNWTVASKLAGLPPPVGPDDKAGIKVLVDFWVKQGFPRDQAEWCLTRDLNFVFGRPGPGLAQPKAAWI
jgi:hypothetical protein